MRFAFKTAPSPTRRVRASTNLNAKLNVIGDNAAMIGVKGGGTFTGSRAAVVASPVELDFTIKLRGIDIG